MARLESQLWHERARALDNSMEPADRTEIAPTGPSAVLESLCVERARRDVSCTPLEEIHESVVRATEYLRLQLSWGCDPTMEDRLVTLHNDIDDTLGAYALCAERNVSVRTELRNHLAWLLGDSRLEGAFDYDSDDYQDDYEDTWDDETAWVKGSTTTPTTTTGGVQFITTPPQPVATPPHVFRFGSPAPPEAVHVDAGKSAMTLNHPADGCADSTADDRASADHRADFYCCCVSCCTNDIIPPQYEVFNDDLLMVELDDADACSVDVRKSERCDSDAGYDDDDDGLLADHVPARAQTVATGADEVSDEDLGAYTAVLDREAVSSWATNMQMECQLARLNVMAKRSLEMNRETNRQLEQVNRQLLSARTARVEEPTHAQSPDCDEGISEVHAGPDDSFMVEVDAMTADEALSSSTDSDHGYEDDDDGILAGKVPSRLILPVAWSPPLFLVDETPHKTMLDIYYELYSVCESLKSRW